MLTCTATRAGGYRQQVQTIHSGDQQQAEPRAAEGDRRAQAEREEAVCRGAAAGSTEEPVTASQ